MNDQLEAPLAKAKGLGSSHEGTAHWWIQRLTSVALVPLVLWCGLSVAMLPGLNHAELVAWIQKPLTTVLLVAIIIAGCYHMALGLRVIIEDYVDRAVIKVTGLILVNLIAILLIIIGIYSVTKIAF